MVRSATCPHRLTRDPARSAPDRAVPATRARRRRASFGSIARGRSTSIRSPPDTGSAASTRRPNTAETYSDVAQMRYQPEQTGVLDTVQHGGAGRRVETDQNLAGRVRVDQLDPHRVVTENRRLDGHAGRRRPPWFVRCPRTAATVPARASDSIFRIESRIPPCSIAPPSRRRTNGRRNERRVRQ